MRTYRGVKNHRCRIRKGRQQCLQEEVRAFDIDVEGAIKHLLVPVFDWHPDGYASIEEGNVELPVMRLNSLRQLLLGCDTS
ncbi:hypothetical protein D3C84_881130 [compost metagenome]